MNSHVVQSASSTGLKIIEAVTTSTSKSAICGVHDAERRGEAEQDEREFAARGQADAPGRGWPCGESPEKRPIAHSTTIFSTMKPKVKPMMVSGFSRTKLKIGRHADA